MKPETYSVKTEENRLSDLPQTYVYQSNTLGVGATDAGITYSCSFEYNGQSSTVTYFPDRPAVKLEESGSPNERSGRSRVVFGLVIMKLILSGEMWVTEL